MSNNIQAVVEQLALPYLESNGFELVDIEYVKEGSNRFLRVFVDKQGGIDIDDCGRISEYLSGKLDEADPIPDAYFLEVSSPGAERPLKKPEDFLRSLHKNVFITTYEPVSGLKEFEGTLIEYTDQEVVVDIRNKQHRIPRDKMASARLAITF